MKRFTFRITRQQLEEVEALVEAGEFPNRSEANRSEAVRYSCNVEVAAGYLKDDFLERGDG